MDKETLKERTKQFSLRIINLSEVLPHTKLGNIIRGQIIRCGTSVGSNYRAACRARSKPDFISKIGIVEEEADESAYWMEIVIERKIVQAELVKPLLKEANEIVAMMVSSRITARNKKS